MLEKIKALQEELEKIAVSGKEEVEELRLKYIRAHNTNVANLIDCALAYRGANCETLRSSIAARRDAAIVVPKSVRIRS